MEKDICYFSSKYNLPGEEYVMCIYSRKYVHHLCCEKCPFYISEKYVEQKIRRFVFERTMKNDKG